MRGSTAARSNNPGRPLTDAMDASLLEEVVEMDDGGDNEDDTSGEDNDNDTDDGGMHL